MGTDLGQTTRTGVLEPETISHNVIGTRCHAKRKSSMLLAPFGIVIVGIQSRQNILDLEHLMTTNVVCNGSGE